MWIKNNQDALNSSDLASTFKRGCRIFKNLCCFLNWLIRVMDLFTEMLMKILFVCVDALRPSQHQQTKKEARESNHSCM